LLTLSQSSNGASGGSTIAKKSMAAGVYPLVVIGGIILLVVIFVLLAKMKKNDSRFKGFSHAIHTPLHAILAAEEAMPSDSRRLPFPASYFSRSFTPSGTRLGSPFARG
jgi:uncharacterized integral membrane protein